MKEQILIKYGVYDVNNLVLGCQTIERGGKQQNPFLKGLHFLLVHFGLLPWVRAAFVWQEALAVNRSVISDWHRAGQWCVTCYKTSASSLLCSDKLLQKTKSLSDYYTRTRTVCESLCAGLDWSTKRISASL